MKILIVDNKNRRRGFNDKLKKHKDVLMENKNFKDIDFSNCKFIFQHDSFNYHLADELKAQIIHVRFSGARTLKNEVLDNAEGYKFKATIENPEQINNILKIIDKDEFSKEDLEMVLGYDSELDKLLKPFATSSQMEIINHKKKI